MMTFAYCSTCYIFKHNFFRRQVNDVKCKLGQWAFLYLEVDLDRTTSFCSEKVHVVFGVISCLAFSSLLIFMTLFSSRLTKEFESGSGSGVVYQKLLNPEPDPRPGTELDPLSY
jgi:hypothetical protein